YRLQINDLLLPASRPPAVQDRDALLGAIVDDIGRQLHNTITAGSVNAQLEAIGERYPALESGVRRRFEMGTLASVFRGLAESGIHVYDARAILECLATTNGRTVVPDEMSRTVFLPETANYCLMEQPSTEKDFSPAELIQAVRSALKAQTAQKYA